MQVLRAQGSIGSAIKAIWERAFADDEESGSVTAAHGYTTELQTQTDYSPRAKEKTETDCSTHAKTR